ncbi:MAG: competence/damage-inducible protein A [Acidobacteria bacterium]|nr:competence/damage-inducible protein A [Acidobacteriota bacterium]
MRQKTAAIIVIGNEILTGKSADQNASFLIKELYALGVALRYVVIIPDEVDEIAKAVRESAAKYDYVFTSGGVGPTHDDLTIPSIARAFNREVVRHPELVALLQGFFGDKMDEPRLRLADAPQDSRLVYGKDLTWPVLATENVYILPGVPEYFRRKFAAISEQFRGEPFYVCAIYTLEEELDIAERLDALAAQHTDVEIGSYPVFSRDDYRVKVTIEAKEVAAVERARDALLAQLKADKLVKTEANYE